jgi:hypothetical protein
MREIEEIKKGIKEGKKIKTIEFVSREERQGPILKMSKEEEKANKAFNDIKIKIIMEHCDEIFKLLARKGYYTYSKDEKGDPFYTPTEILVIKIMSEVLSIHKKDGYLNEIYVDNNEKEMVQECFPVFIDTSLRCFPGVIFPTEWFGDYNKKRWEEVQAFVIASILAATFGLEDTIRGFFDNRYYKDMGILLDWCINIKKVPKSRAFTIVAGEIGKSTSFVRDHYTLI